MSANILTRDLSPKRIRQIVFTLVSLLILVLTTRAVVQRLAQAPKSPEQVRKIVQNYLKEKSKTENFRSDVRIQTETQVGDLSTEVAALQTSYEQLSAKRSTMREGSNALEEAVAAAQKAVRAAQRNVDSLKKPSDPGVASAEAPDPRPAALAELETARTALKQQETLLSAAKEASSLNRTQRNEARDRLNTKERELGRLKAEARNVAGAIGREFETALKAATSYEAVYKIIGQELWAVEQMMAGNEPAQTAGAINLAQLSSRHAIRFGYDDWLAARICEGYLLPQAGLLAGEGGRRSPIEDGLQHAVSVFNMAEEPRNVERTYEAMIEFAPDPGRADSARFRLARVLESQGKFEQALAQFQAIQSEKLARNAKQRIENLQRRLE